MKRPISLTFYFLFSLIAGSLIGIIFYILYFNSTIMVAGETVKFSKDFFIFALKDIIPLVIIFSPAAMIIYKARHKENPVASAIVYAFLCAFAWILLFPLQMTFSEKISKNIPPKEEIQNSKEISGGYFRNINSSTFFFVENSKDKKAKVIEIANSDNPSFFAEEKEISVAKDSEFASYSSPYRDSLVKETASTLFVKPIQVFKNFIDRCYNAFECGFISWLCFCSVGLLMSSMYAFLKVSEWKLINIFTSLILFISAIFINDFYFSPAMNGARAILYELFYKCKLFLFLSNKGADVPLMFANILLTMIALVCGILISNITKKHIEGR